MNLGGFFFALLPVQLLLELAPLFSAQAPLHLETLLVLVAQQHALRTLWILIQIHLDPTDITPKVQVYGVAQ